jgi:ubiquitin carboxyl-terminal hydrolase 8
VQQDAQEFIGFVFDQLDDETNTLRSVTGDVPFPDMRHKSPLQGAQEYWQSWSTLHGSVIDKYWRGLEALTMTCLTCRVTSVRYQTIESLNLSFPRQARLEAVRGRQGTALTTFRLEDLLKEYSKLESMHGEDAYMCDTCGQKRNAERQTRLARLPDRFAIFLWRFIHDEDGMKKKINNTVTFPITGLDLTPYSLEAKPSAINAAPTNGNGGNVSSRHFQAPFVYDCYAAVQHIGNTIESGHYIAYVKDDNPADATAWHKFDDHRITPIRVSGQGGGAGGGGGGGGAGNGADVSGATGELYGRGNAQAYLVFYQRRGSPGT